MKAILSSLLLILMLAVGFSSAQAQETTTTRLSESQLTQALNNLLPYMELDNFLASINTMTLDLREMEVVMLGTLTHTNGEVWNYEFSIVPVIIENRLNWTLATVVITASNHSVLSPRDVASGRATGSIVELWERVFYTALSNAVTFAEPSQLRSLPVYALMISMTDLLVTSAVAPEQAVRSQTNNTAAADGTYQLVIDQRQANAALVAIARRHERIETYTIDFTASGFVIEITGRTPNDAPLGIIAILIGLVADQGGHREMQIQLSTISITPASAANNPALRDFVLDSWSRFLDLQIGEASVIDFILTEDALILTLEP